MSFLPLHWRSYCCLVFWSLRTLQAASISRNLSDVESTADGSFSRRRSGWYCWFPTRMTIPGWRHNTQSISVNVILLGQQSRDERMEKNHGGIDENWMRDHRGRPWESSMSTCISVLTNTEHLITIILHIIGLLRFFFSYFHRCSVFLFS